MNSDQDRVVEILNEALNQPSAGARARYVLEACGGDDALRKQVEALLQAHTEAGDFLKPPADDPAEAECPGTVIGHYKLLQVIGEGGFGRVYMADQVEPVRRKVALKIIKLGMDTREVVARFETERQALALMDHPNIARVLDGGTTGTGRPYFVMELVKGVPITDYCDQQNLSTQERLALFVRVCHAVQHAHQKGVIHRDLKPSNILVTEHDGEALPKIIDFGVAKAIGQRLTDKTLFTRLEQMIGTPVYMSPEQAGLGSLDLDTRTDIYALGVLLYELLTGTTPVLRETLHQAALDEVRRMIRETEPPKPSTRLQTLGAKLTEVAQHRHAEPAALRKLVRGDLDWIVMKCLEKDRQRRYDTAEALAQDLERYWKQEPVSASPPSTAYRAGKFVRRHRVGVGMGAVVSVALLVGLALALVGFNQARRQRDRAENEAAIAKAVNEFLQQDLLARADPENEPDRHLELRTVLDRAAAKIEDRFTHQPLVEASIRLTLGETYLNLGEAKAAEPHLRRAVELGTKALGPEHPETLKAMERLGRLELELVRYEQDKLLRQFTRLEVIGDDRASESYEEAKRFLQGLWETERRVLGADHANTLETQRTLAAAFFSRNRTDKAVGLLREVLEKQRRLLGPEHPSVLISMSSLATLYSSSDQFSKAAEMNEELLAVTRRLKGAESPRTLALMHNLANDYGALGRQNDALPLLQSVVETRRRVLGTNHPSTLLAMNHLGWLFGQLYLWKDCIEVCRALVSATNWLEIPWQGVVAAAVVGDTNSYRYFAEAALSRLSSTTNASSAREIANNCLLLPDALPDLDPVLKLADLAIGGVPAEASHGRMAKGLAEYRRGHWREALGWLDGPNGRQCGVNYRASWSGYICAMAHYQLGEESAARAALEEAGQRLADSVGSGDTSDWATYGRNVVLRAETERLILGREVSTVIDRASLEQTRKRWAPVRHWLLEANRLAGQRQWPQARDAFQRAMNEPAFDWGIAEDDMLNLAHVTAVTFLLARDFEAHERLCRFLFSRLEHRPDAFFSHQYSRAWLARDGGDPDLVQKAVKWTKIAVRFEEELNALVRGMADYRLGRYEEALESLRGAPGSKYLGYDGAVQLFKVMALKKLGRNAEAADLLQQVEARLAQPLEDLWGDRWFALAYCQIALDEARGLLGMGSSPGK